MIATATAHVTGNSKMVDEKEVPRRQSHRRSGLANLPSVGAVP